jgi:hypothetical protein
MRSLEVVLANAEAFRWLFFLGLLWAFYRWMQSDNGIEWRDFISARGADGQYHGDINKLGQVTGIAFGSLAVMLVSGNAKSDFVGFAAVLTAYFAFVGGAAGYSAYLRSRSAITETKTVTEPVPLPQPEKKTVTVTQPTTQEGKT